MTSPEAFRAQFPIFEKKIFLNSCSKGALSSRVADAYGDYLDAWRHHGSPWEQWVALLEEVRTRYAAFLGCRVDELAVSYSASSAVASLLSAIAFEGERDGIVLGDFEFPTVAHNILAQTRRGARIVRVRADGETLPASAYAAALDERVRLAPVTHVCYRNGYRQDLSAVVEAASSSGAWTLVDDYQSTGTAEIDVHGLGCDFLVTGVLKYMLGSSGLGLLYVREALVEALEPTVTGWFAQEKPFDFDIERATYHRSARRFEMGTPPVPNLYAGLAGLTVLESAGPRAVQEHVERLASRLIAGARSLGVRVLTPDAPSRRGALVVLGVSDADDAVAGLAREDIVVSARGSGLRVSFHYYNVDSDVDAVLGVLSRAPRWILRED